MSNPYYNSILQCNTSLFPCTIPSFLFCFHSMSSPLSPFFYQTVIRFRLRYFHIQMFVNVVVDTVACPSLFFSLKAFVFHLTLLYFYNNNNKNYLKRIRFGFCCTFPFCSSLSRFDLTMNVTCFYKIGDCVSCI